MMYLPFVMLYEILYCWEVVDKIIKHSLMWIRKLICVVFCMCGCESNWDEVLLAHVASIKSFVVEVALSAVMLATNHQSFTQAMKMNWVLATVKNDVGVLVPTNIA